MTDLNDMIKIGIYMYVMSESMSALVMMDNLFYKLVYNFTMFANIQYDKFSILYHIL